MSLTLGIDPDSKDLSWALWGPSGPVSAGVVHVTGASGDYQIIDALEHDCDAVLEEMAALEMPITTIVVEGQQFDTRAARKQDILKLAHVTGAAAYWARYQCEGARLIIPTPFEWKKGVPKAPHQARLYDRLGWGYVTCGSYSRPETPPPEFSHITKGQWKHVGDALGLAKWGHEQRTK